MDAPVNVIDPSIAVVNQRHGTDIETELRLFMRDTAQSISGVGVHLATMTERLTGVRDEQKSLQADMKTIPERVSRLEEIVKTWEKNEARRLTITAIVVAIAGILIPLILKGLQSK